MTEKVSNEEKWMPQVADQRRTEIGMTERSPAPQSPAFRSHAALPADYRRLLEESNLPIEVATAIADRVDAALSERGEKLYTLKDLEIHSQLAIDAYEKARKQESRNVGKAEIGSGRTGMSAESASYAKAHGQPERGLFADDLITREVGTQVFGESVTAKHALWTTWQLVHDGEVATPSSIDTSDAEQLARELIEWATTPYTPDHDDPFAESMGAIRENTLKVCRALLAFRAASASLSAIQPSVTLAEILRAADHIEKNGFDVARFGGEMKDEGRCRELCAMYLREFAINYEMGERLKSLDLERSSGPEEKR